MDLLSFSMKMEDISQFILNSQLTPFKNVIEVIDIKSQSACGENENFVGQVLRVEYLLKLKTGEMNKINVIVKKAPLAEQRFTKMYTEFKVFDSEVEMYEKVLHNMEKLVNSCNEPNWMLWPQYYGHNNSDIFLQDLREDGYRSYPKAKPLELNDALLVLKTLGQFHGLSLAVIQNGEYDASNMLPNIFVRKVSAFCALQDECCEDLADVIEAEWGEEWQCFPEKLRKLPDYVHKHGIEIWRETRGKFDVINHGDCWINNILFKYDDSGAVQHVKLVDFQACHYNSYSWDIMQVLSCAVTPSLRKDNLDLLLATYQETLSNTAKTVGFEGDIPTLEQVKTELDRLDPLALMRSIVCYSYFYNPDAFEHISSNEGENNKQPPNKSYLYKSDFVKEIIQDTLVYFRDRNVF